MPRNAAYLASLVGTEQPVPEQTYAIKLFASAAIQPGTRIPLANGKQAMVHSKRASKAGTSFNIAVDGHIWSMTASQAASLPVVSPALGKLASAVIRVLAANPTEAVDQIIKSAIEQAGYPVDPTMHWGKYLYKMYGPIAHALDGGDYLEDAIMDIIVRQLYEKQLLSPKSSYKGFDPNRPELQGKPMAQRVSMYLSNLFSFKRSAVAEKIKKLMGMSEDDKHTLELEPSASSEEGTAKVEVIDENAARAMDENDGQQDIRSFLKAFTDQVVSKQVEANRAILNAITKAYSEGYDKIEVRDQVFADPTVKALPPNKLTRDNYNYMLRRWTQMLTEFAKNPSNPWSQTPIATEVARAAQKATKGEPAAAKPVPVAASLKLADYERNGQPEGAQTNPQQPSQATPQQQQIQQPTGQQQNSMHTAPPPPARPNNGLVTAPVQDPNAPPDQDEQQNQPRKTITPEIPGVNHTASQETPMPKNDPITAPKTAKKATYNTYTDEQGRPVPATGDLERTPQYSGEHGCRSFIPSENRVCMAPEKVIWNGMKFCMKHAPREAKQELAQRSQATPEKFAGLKHFAATEPQEVHAALAQIASGLRRTARKIEAMQSRYDLTPMTPMPHVAAEGKQATVREKIAAKNKYARSLKKAAEEAPESVESDMQELYAMMEESVDQLEILADNFNVSLDAPAELTTDFSTSEDMGDDTPEQVEAENEAAV